jgi:general secretion pathway protein E
MQNAQEGLANTLRLSPKAVATARQTAAAERVSLLAALAKHLGVDEEAAADAAARSLGFSVVDAGALHTMQPDFARMTFTQAQERRAALARDADNRLIALLTDPFDADTASACRRIGAESILIAAGARFDEWMTRAGANVSALRSVDPGERDNGSQASTGTAERLSLAAIDGDSSPTVRFINSTLYDALRAGASDIHIESATQGLIVKFRLDGVLNEMSRFEGRGFAERAISRIKVMAELDIAERRIPQDGRLAVQHDDRTIDVRVSIMPSLHGEDAVLRILDRQHLADTLEGLTLGKLGLDGATADSLRRLCLQPYGMVLVTGPTGSGKTTTLYAALAETHQPREKVITIEDPVEYQLTDTLQIPVNEKKGLTFARGLRSILRHDPDKILVGEIRDADTAQIAVQSALTGHLVLTTVHANHVFDVLGRFTQFGLDTYAFVSALNGILAQRLVRKVCMHCARGISPSQQVFEASAIPAQSRDAGNWVAAVGCEACRGTGYKGRFAIGELLKLTPQMKQLMASPGSFGLLEEAARLAGLTTLRERAIQSAAAGATTLEEIDRVTAVA